MGGAMKAMAALKVSMQALTEAAGVEDVLVEYQKELGVYVPPDAMQWTFTGVWTASTVYTITGVLGGILCAIFFSVCIGFVALTHREKLKYEARQNIRCEEVLDEVERTRNLIGFPMALVSVVDFLQLGCLVPYETLRESNRLRVLSTLEQVRDFKNDTLILYMSHQWLGRAAPDPSNVHYDAMCSAVRSVAKIFGVGNLRQIHVWIDFCSTPQEHVATRELAIASWHLYAAVSDVFIAVAPPTTHCDTLVPCGVSTYFERGWCRAEVLAKLSGSGLRHVYVCSGTSGDLQVVTRDLLDTSRLRVFEGEFHCCALQHVYAAQCDREKLKVPVLAMYAECLRDRVRFERFGENQEGAAQEGENPSAVALEFLKNDTTRVFPERFQFERRSGMSEATHVEERELFGSLPSMVEERETSRTTRGVASIIIACTQTYCDLRECTDLSIFNQSDVDDAEDCEI